MCTHLESPSQKAESVYIFLFAQQKLVQHMERHKTGRPVASRTRGRRNRMKSASSSQQSGKPEKSAPGDFDPSSDADSECTVVALLRECESDEENGKETGTPAGALNLVSSH